VALRVLVHGVGDIGSAVAHRLFLAGHVVVVHDSEQSTTTRRGMAFTDAIFDGRTMLMKSKRSAWMSWMLCLQSSPATPSFPSWWGISVLFSG